MIQVTAQTRILVAVKPADFRCGIDGLARLCRQALVSDPFTGAVFVFPGFSLCCFYVLFFRGVRCCCPRVFFMRGGFFLC